MLKLSLELENIVRFKKYLFNIKCKNEINIEKRISVYKFIIKNLL